MQKLDQGKEPGFARVLADHRRGYLRPRPSAARIFGQRVIWALVRPVFRVASLEARPHRRIVGMVI